MDIVLVFNLPFVGVGAVVGTVVGTEIKKNRL